MPQHKIFQLSPLKSNCIVVWTDLVKDKKEGIVIDPGPNPDEVLAFLKAEKIKVVYILVTHGHFDHCYGCWLIKKQYKCPILMHNEDLQQLKLNIYNSVNYGVPVPKYYLLNVDGSLADGKSITVRDINLTVIHTPGHTYGSVCFLINNSLLITGDTLFTDGRVPTTTQPGGNSSSLHQSYMKLKTLFTNSDNVVIIPGHGETGMLFKVLYSLV